MAKRTTGKTVAAITHGDASRRNIPTAEYQAVMAADDRSPIQVAYERRNRDLDPQLVWRGKDAQDWSDLVVQAPPLFIQEKVHPKVLIDDLRRRSKEAAAGNDDASGFQADLFADFNGLPSADARTEFYRHDANWSNRMILGDSLQVMASLAEREGLRGKVQCIYLDPPYGIRFNSNFQWSTTSRDVKDGNAAHITREPEQVKAFRDTWRDGIHSYLTYLRDRLTMARDLLTESGSIFVQIGDENVHRVRAVMDEVFGEENFVALIPYLTTTSQSASGIGSVADHLVWYAKSKPSAKYHQLYAPKEPAATGGWALNHARFDGVTYRPLTREERRHHHVLPNDAELYRLDNLTSQGTTPSGTVEFEFRQKRYHPGGRNHWKTTQDGMRILLQANRIQASKNSIQYIRFFDDFAIQPISNIWTDSTQAGFIDSKLYVVQTVSKVIERCILMTTDPGDLVLDPTCGSGTTAYVAEQWGRRWITVDTSRVALALARARVMGARYPWYPLADSHEGQQKEAEIARRAPADTPTYDDIRHGFVYERVPHITLRSIANNAEIEVIWEKWQETIQPLLALLGAVVRATHASPVPEWEIPRDLPDDWPPVAAPLHEQFWAARIARQNEIDASIAAKADYEYLYDKPHQDNKKVRVAGPFTVESLSPHRLLGVDENDDLIDNVAEDKLGYGGPQDFVGMVLENLKTAGVQQAHKDDRITFSAIKPWPGYHVCAEGTYIEGDPDSGAQKRAGVFIGPEFGTVSRPDLVEAVREAADAGFDVLIACAFNYDAHASEFNKLGRVPILKARMNADLHMAGDLKNTGHGNLFVIFGEPDIDILKADKGQIQVRINGVDVFHPNTGEIRSDNADGIACWFVDTDYNEESFFVRHAYFLGANDPYKALKTTLKAEINEEAWETLRSDTSRPFAKPQSGRIAVKVINHLGDEVMKVFRV